MRPYYPSKTTRNFISCAGIHADDKKMSGLSFEAIFEYRKGACFDFQTQAHELAYDARKTLSKFSSYLIPT